MKCSHFASSNVSRILANEAQPAQKRSAGQSTGSAAGTTKPMYTWMHLVLLLLPMTSALSVVQPHAPVDAACELAVVHPDKGCPAVLIRAALDERQQRALYEDLCRSVAQSEEWKVLADTMSEPRYQPRPLAVWNHPYTGRSNMPSQPRPVFDVACRLQNCVACELSRREGDATALMLRTRLEDTRYDSLISLLYDEEGTLSSHVDGGLRGLGLSLSLGASCTFSYGGRKIDLASGDALFGDFGHVRHKVWVWPADTAPSWWLSLPKARADMKPEEGSYSCSFGRARCNVQFRRGWNAEERQKLREMGYEFYD